MLALKSSYSIMEAKWKEQPSNPPPKASWLAFFFFCGNGFFPLYQYGGLVQPQLTLSQTVHYSVLMSTAAAESLPASHNITCSSLVVTENSKGTVAQIPLPKWRKEKLSCAGRPVTIRLRMRRVC